MKNSTVNLSNHMQRMESLKSKFPKQESESRTTQVCQEDPTKLMTVACYQEEAVCTKLFWQLQIDNILPVWILRNM